MNKIHLFGLGVFASLLILLWMLGCSSSPSATPADPASSLSPTAAARPQTTATRTATVQPTAAPTSRPTNTPVPPVTPIAAKATPTNPAASLIPVFEVVDGDTVKVRLDNRTESIRIIGIDTPEVVDPREPVQCFGREASAKAKELLSVKQVRLIADPTQGERDKYDRLLRYVDLADGTDFGLWMIQNGYAHEYTYNTPYQRQAEYKAAYAEARSKGVGLWAADTCNGDTKQPAASTQPSPVPVVPPPVAPVVPLAPPPTATATPRPAATATRVLAVPTVAPQAGNCDPAYPDFCIPPPPPDLDCKDIPRKRFKVLPPDPHRLDGNKDGVGCES